MRSVPVAALFTLLLFLALSGLRAERAVRLCGQEFHRALLHQCGASRWRREPASEAAPRDFNRFPGDSNPRWGWSSEDFTDHSDLLGGDQNPYRPKFKRNLNKIADLCCKNGCSKKHLNSIC
ncbi:insulin-like peptide INSL5 [Mustelus asterias]